MKMLFAREKEYLCARLRDIPVITTCRVIDQQKDGFLVSLSFTDDTQVTLDVTVLKRAYPSVIAALEKKEERNRDMYPVVVVPYTFLIKNYVGSLERLASEFSRYSMTTLVRKNSKKLSGKFESVEHAGAADVAKFVGETDEEEVE